MATNSSILAWKIPWTEESGGLQSMGSQGVGHDLATSLSASVKRWGSEGKSPKWLLIFRVPSSSGAALGHHRAALPGEVLPQRTGMLALTHSHLALGDYKFQHPPLATRPRPPFKGRLGALPAAGTSGPRCLWQAGTAASLALTQPPTLSRCSGVDPFVAGGFLAPR